MSGATNPNSWILSAGQHPDNLIRQHPTGLLVLLVLLMLHTMRHPRSCLNHRNSIISMWSKQLQGHSCMELVLRKTWQAIARDRP